jgi:hypothetical protein
LTDSAPGSALPAADGAFSGAAVAAPDWTAAANRAVTATSAPAAARRWVVRERVVLVWEVLWEVLWEVRLWDWRLNTDSFCMAAGHTAGETGRLVTVRAEQVNAKTT